MEHKPQYKQYIPLFEKYNEINRRFAALPQQMQEDIQKIVDVDCNVVFAESLSAYLLGKTSDAPENIDIVLEHIEKEDRTSDDYQTEDGLAAWFEQLGVETGVQVFECAGVKTLPMSLGNMTVLAEQPTAITQYRMPFVKTKKVKDTSNVKEKTQNFDAKKQPHVKKDNNIQDAPKS